MNLSQDDASEEAQKENEDRPEQTNSQLIAQQHIVNVAPVEKNYRFYLVDKNPAFAVEDTAVLQEMKDDAAQAGTLSRNDVVYILGDLKNGWYYVESGTVRGFIRAEKLTDAAATQKLIERYQNHAARVSRLTGTTVSAESYYRCAAATVPVRENAAAMYSLATVYDRVVAKNDAVTKDVTGGLGVHDAMRSDASEVGVLEAGDLAYILSECGDWAYIESGDVRGFVRERYLKTGAEAAAVIQEKGGEDSMSVAEETVSPEDNAAFYYMTSSIKEGTAENPVRKALLQTAESCVGNPYVWGGTSLTNGCDCSGFVQTLYGLYGISLPRVAEQQAGAGTQIPVSEAEPGDLIFFAKNGYVYHVAICSGDNTTIEAYNSQMGIINNTLDTAHAVWAVRVLDS